MTSEKKFALIILAVSIAATIATGSLAFLLQQRIAAIDAKKTGAGRELTSIIANWQEAQRHIDLAVLHEDIANFGTGSTAARQQVLHTVSQEIGRAWFYKQLAITPDQNVLDAQQRSFVAAEEEAKRLNSIEPITSFFDNVFKTFESRLKQLESQQDRLQEESSRLRLWQLILTQLAVGLQVAVIILAFFMLQHQKQGHK